jgi:hypothetical protein
MSLEAFYLHNKCQPAPTTGDDDMSSLSEPPVPAPGNAPSGGISSLPVVGRAAGGARQFFGEVAPNANDPTEVRFAKEILRWTTVAAGAALWAVVVLGAGPRETGMDGEISA